MSVSLERRLPSEPDTQAVPISKPAAIILPPPRSRCRKRLLGVHDCSSETWIQRLVCKSAQTAGGRCGLEELVLAAEHLRDRLVREDGADRVRQQVRAGEDADV